MAALQVGRLTLHRCETRAPWCGSLSRRLDPGGAVPGSISVYFEYYPHTGGGAAAGTLVATEGGPGYPAAGSRSAALDCEPLQTAAVLTEANVGVCGRSLGRAAPLYGTALATDDLAAIVEALSLGRIDLYGDSYGSYFAQVFALRHPQRLRSLVLDGAYPLDGPDYPWYPNYAPAMRDKFNRACERAPACRAIAGSSLEHIAPALELLRAGPFGAEVRYGRGRFMRFTAEAGELAIVMFGGAPAQASVRAGCGGVRFQRRGPVTVAQTDGGNAGQRGFARQHTLAAAVQRGAGGRGVLPGPAADLRHEPRACRAPDRT